MNCRKQLVLTGYRVQYIDLREPKPRTPKETVHVVDRQWLYALGVTGQNVICNIRDQYERAGYKVFAVEPIKSQRVAELDLRQLWESVEPPATGEQTGGEANRDDRSKCQAH